jgi:hypothetical protein
MWSNKFCITEFVDSAVMLWTHIWEGLGSNLSWDISYHDRGFLFQSLQANAGIVP